MVWNKTPPKMKEIKEGGDVPEGEGAEGENGDSPDGEDKKDEADKEDARSNQDEDNISRVNEEGEAVDITHQEIVEKEVPKPKQYIQLPYLEEDFATRVPSSEYEEIKRIEDEILEFKKENVKCYVLASGIMYGMGESIFESHFKKAWLQDPERLPFVGEGKNLVPTVHVKDLARMVKKVFETKPEKYYIFAVDNTRRPYQKRLISAISNGIGAGLIEAIDYPDNSKKRHPKKTPLQLDLDWRVPLMLNLKLKPSSLFISANEEEEPVDFNWHSKQGLAFNIQLVKEEFCVKRGLKPVKILLTGPPITGKSFFGKQLSQHYNVPHIYLKKMLEDISFWNNEKEEVIYRKRDIKRKAREEQDRIIAEEKARVEAEKQALRQAKADKGEDPDEPAEKQEEDKKEGEQPPAEAEANPEGEGEEKKPEEDGKESDSDDDYLDIEIK